jgi:hypothetical protein
MYELMMEIEIKNYYYHFQLTVANWILTINKLSIFFKNNHLFKDM